jgi:cell division protein FtsL
MRSDPAKAGNAPPSLVVLEAVRGAKQPHDALLLTEAIRRRALLYAILATSTGGGGVEELLCAYVTLLTIANRDRNVREKGELQEQFRELLLEMLTLGRSLEVVI